MSEGLFVVLEGIDGAGTTTQTNRLVQALRARNVAARSTREPSDGPIGTTIRQVLTGRLVLPGSSAGGPAQPLSWGTLALLFAADRLDHLEAEIEPLLREGVTVVSDRYDISSVAYQGISSGQPDVADWIRAINGRARRPDLTLVLDVSAQTANRRRKHRGARPELYEHDDLQARLATFYLEIEKYFQHDKVVHLNGEASEDDIHAAVLRTVEAAHASR
ncbi:MAG: dTMP kinase [Myxococcales bacterium]|nr:dTMP kinase [Myxococcales bacterium]